VHCVSGIASVWLPMLGDEVVGYMIYELHKSRLHLLSLAIDPGYRRRGIGRAMVQKLIDKLSFQRRNRLLLEIRETNLEGQLFFKEMGFRAISVLYQFYDQSHEDAYLMQFRASDVVSSDMEPVE
jgi:[ribosomal protein S18]-alanine N-acetyltransferase